ncbi:MAG TPA: transposase [Terriglobia bacterium]|nr:transposase [Terriglobia bacterium]
MPVRWRDAAATGIMKYNPKMHRRRSIRLRGYDYARPGSYFVTVCAHRRGLLFGEVIDGQMRRNALGDIVHAGWYATERVRPEVRLDAFVVMPNHLHGILEIIDVGARRRLAPDANSKMADGKRATHRVAPTAYRQMDESQIRPRGAGVVGARRRLAPTEGARSRPHGPAPGSVGAILGQIKSLTKKAINKTRGTPGRAVWQPNYHEHVIRNENELQRIREYICNNPLRWPSDRENPARQSDAADEIADIVSWDDDPCQKR